MTRPQSSTLVNHMKHHYVPQFLLRQWAKGSHDRKLQVFHLNRPGLPNSRLGTKSTGYEENLYALSKPSIAGMKQQAVEMHLWSPIDNCAAVVRNKLENVGLSLTPIERFCWTRFIMSLRLRQPQVLAKLKGDSADHLRTILSSQPEEYEVLRSDKDAPTLTEWTEQKYPGLIEDFGLSMFPGLVDDHKTALSIFNMRWWLWDFSSESDSLLLSDNPCIFTGGIDADNLVIALPISPTKAFLSSKSDRTAAVIRRQSAPQLLALINESSLIQSRSRIYARDDRADALIRGIMKGRYGR